MAVCKFCGKEMIGSSSCIESYIIIDGSKYQPVRFGKKQRTVFEQKQFQARCSECNVMPGGFHHIGCDLEICPKCSNRWIYCRCAGIKTKIDKHSKSKCKIISFTGTRKSKLKK